MEELKQPKDEHEGAIPVLVVYDHKSGATFSGVVNKGVDPYGLAIITEALKFCGRQKVVTMSDGERSIKALAEAAAKSWGKEAALQTSAKGSHQSNGAVERAILENAKQVRTVINAFEMRFGIKVQVEDQYFPWLVRHSSWLISRFLVKSDGKTPYERLRGREYRGEVVEPCEVVHYKLEAPGKMEPKTAVGVWLGKSNTSDEHLVGTPQGIRRCRSCYRRPEGKRWDKTVLDRMRGTPWQPKGEPTAVRGQPPTPGTPGRRGVCITLERQIEHGATPGCPGCNTVYGDNPKPHSPECRARFEKLLGKAVNPQPSTPAAPPASAGDSAEVAADRTRETPAPVAKRAKTKRPEAAGSSTKGTWEQLPEGAQSSSSGLRRPAADETAGAAESKRRKEAEAKGQKREAETPQRCLEEVVR